MTDESKEQSPAARSASGAVSAERLMWTTYESPIGCLTLIAGASGICGVRYPGGPAPPAQAVRQAMPRAAQQLASYFAGERQGFELDLDLRGTPLQRLVWEQLLQIPYGATTTYGELARRIDETVYPAGLEAYKRARLVGSAIGRTPTPIVVPCHRVIGADGSLTGYGGGLPRKQALLDLESGRVGHGAPEPDAAKQQLALL
jgi:methylated-DNA-[protein]-cysteine S-methyltransferase